MTCKKPTSTKNNLLTAIEKVGITLIKNIYFKLVKFIFERIKTVIKPREATKFKW